MSSWGKLAMKLQIEILYPDISKVYKEVVFNIRPEFPHKIEDGWLKIKIPQPDKSKMFKEKKKEK